MRAALTLLITVHGAIHLLGFFKWSKLHAVPQLSGRTLLPLSHTAELVFAAAWHLAFVLLLVAAGLRVLRHDAWAPVVLWALTLSQCLIIFAWRDAKFGTLANLLLLVPALATAAHTRFNREVSAEAQTLLAHASRAPGSVVQASELLTLPAPVQRWLTTSGVVGRERVKTVRLKQEGELRTSAEGAWMPAQAEQYFSIDPPQFLWKVDATMLGFVPISGRDRYVDGRGQMLIRAASLVNVVNAADDKITHGSLLRFLGEIVWFPSAALSPRLAWEALDGESAKVTMSYEGVSASAVFKFREDGRVVGMHALRYLGGGLNAKLTPWFVTCSEWREFEGVVVPTRGEVSWKIEAGEFTYYRWQILELELNRADVYEATSAPDFTLTMNTTAAQTRHHLLLGKTPQ